ncbi:hypothetical protein E0485_05785 [Paenibacillus albiflavus]|uniref:Uncharacterized protein n=1 Tax=Paenibacillus albiflavus TaxID=2545760 RepID=A0A4R4ELP0_9BACL|nr:hypothetical protein [Paenibacillus albiflavus]TCZ79371.1 hypothetical protein E0485_05785 [Paenibacillus albiflavus]
MSEELIKNLALIQNRVVQFIRLAGNSLIIYCECEPGNKDHGYSIWLEPTWHFRNNEHVITGSREAQTEDEQEHFNISEQFKILYFKSIKRVTIEPITNDLEIEFDEGYFIRTFVSDPNDEESWHIRDYYKQIKVIGNPKSIEYRE